MSMNKITEILDRFPNGLNASQICAAVGTRSTAERKAVKEALKGMEKQCLVFYDSRSHRYRMAAEGDYGQAVFDGNRRGFGFLEMEEGEDLFVPPSKTNGAFHKDLVAYKRIAGTKDEAEVVKILKRGTWQIVGVYDEKEKVGFVIPDEDKFSQDVFIGEGKNLGARNGQKVVAKITVIGKTPVLFLALDPTEYIDTKYRAEDASKYSKYANTPFRFKINGERKVGYARELIGRTMQEFEFAGESKTLPDIPYMDDESLLAEGLIKRI